MATIKQLLHINAGTEKLYQAISTVKGLQNWWTIQTSGEEGLGGTLSFRFGEMGPDFRVVELVPGKRVKWECTGGFPDWIGTTLQFELDQNEGKTRLRFEHANWKEDNDFYAACSFSWGRYLESLRQYCQTGKGEAFGSTGYRN